MAILQDLSKEWCFARTCKKKNYKTMHHQAILHTYLTYKMTNRFRLGLFQSSKYNHHETKSISDILCPEPKKSHPLRGRRLQLNFRGNAMIDKNWIATKKILAARVIVVKSVLNCHYSLHSSHFLSIFSVHLCYLMKKRCLFHYLSAVGQQRGSVKCGRTWCSRPTSWVIWLPNEEEIKNVQKHTYLSTNH